MPTKTLPSTYEQLRAILAEHLGIEPGDIGDTDSLFELGMDSVTAISMVGSWRRAGLKCMADDFIDSPTLGDWWLMLRKQR